MKLFLKEIVKKLIRLTPHYKSKKKTLENGFSEESSFLSVDFINKNFISKIPFYSNYLSITKFDDIPFLKKTDIIQQEFSIVNKKFNYKKLRKTSTGGSTGTSLTLYRHFNDNIFETAMSDVIFNKIGNDLTVGVLRGHKPKKGLFQKINSKYFLLSSYDLSSKNIDEYLNFIQQKKINCLHVYPSALMILIKLIEDKKYFNILPSLKGIVSSSEVLTYENKVKILKILPNIKLIDYYGHNELACCAYAEGLNPYKFNNNYGYVEFFDTENDINGNSIKEIIATSIVNKTMPFLRYKTEDYVEIDTENNIVSIIGRSSDVILNKNNEIVPCIVLTRPISLINVLNFQYHQNTVGILNFRVVVNKDFSNFDSECIKYDISNSFSNNIDCNIIIVDNIEKTKIGKQKRLIQELTF